MNEYQILQLRKRVPWSACLLLQNSTLNKDFFLKSVIGTMACSMSLGNCFLSFYMFNVGIRCCLLILTEQKTSLVLTQNSQKELFIQAYKWLVKPSKYVYTLAQK